MLKKMLSLALAVVLVSLVGASPAKAVSKTEKDARVELKLRDNTKLKGYISEVGADSFVVVDA